MRYGAPRAGGSPVRPGRRVRVLRLAAAALLSWLAAASHAQPDAPTRLIEIELGAPTGPEILSDAAPERPALTVHAQRRSSTAPVRRRDPAVPPWHLVVAGLDARGHELVRTVIADPRIVRHEAVDADGAFTALQILYRNRVRFTVQLPDDPEIAWLQVTTPRWNGVAHALETIAETRLPEIRDER